MEKGRDYCTDESLGDLDKNTERVGLGWGLRVRIATELPGKADAARPCTTH